MSKLRFFVSAFIALMCCYSVLLNAEILDGGEIQFEGYVTDEAPKWTWQVTSSNQFWSVDTADARQENNELVFNLKDKGELPFLEGHLFSVAERGGGGFIPLITFSSAGMPFIINEGNSNTQTFRAQVPVTNTSDGKEVGRLSFTLVQGLAVSIGTQVDSISVPAGMALINGNTVANAQSSTLNESIKSRLSSLLLMNNGFSADMSAIDSGRVLNQNVLTDGRLMNLAAAYASSISDFELRFPVDDTPSQWQAKIAVTVTVQ